MSDGTENLLAAALRAETLDESLRPIMRALGITTGDCAAAIFSALPRGDDSWPELSLETRGHWLLKWFQAELFGAAYEVLEQPERKLTTRMSGG